MAPSASGAPPGTGSDAFALAEPIAGCGTFTFDNSVATEAHFDACSIYNDVWFCWTSPSDGDFTLETCGLTGLDTQIAVYDGCAEASYVTLLACNDDACGVQSRVAFTAVEGNSYALRIGTFLATPGGTGQFTLAGPDCPIDVTCTFQGATFCTGETRNLTATLVNSSSGDVSGSWSVQGGGGFYSLPPGGPYTVPASSSVDIQVPVTSTLYHPGTETLVFDAGVTGAEAPVANEPQPTASLAAACFCEGDGTVDVQLQIANPASVAINATWSIAAVAGFTATPNTGTMAIAAGMTYTGTVQVNATTAAPASKTVTLTVTSNCGNATATADWVNLDLKQLDVDMRGKKYDQAFAFTLTVDPAGAAGCAAVINSLVWEHQTGSTGAAWNQFAVGGLTKSKTFSPGWWRVRVRCPNDLQANQAATSPWVAAMKVEFKKINGENASEGDKSDVYISWGTKVKNYVTYEVLGIPETKPPPNQNQLEGGRTYTWSYPGNPSTSFSPNGTKGAKETKFTAPANCAAATAVADKDMGKAICVYKLPIDGEDFTVETHVFLNILKPTKALVTKIPGPRKTVKGRVTTRRKFDFRLETTYKVVDQFDRPLGKDTGDLKLPNHASTIVVWEELRMLKGWTKLIGCPRPKKNELKDCYTAGASGILNPKKKIFSMYGRDPEIEFQTTKTGSRIKRIMGSRPKWKHIFKATGNVFPVVQAKHFDGPPGGPLKRFFEVHQFLRFQGCLINPLRPNILWLDKDGPHAQKHPGGAGTDLATGNLVE